MRLPFFDNEFFDVVFNGRSVAESRGHKGVDWPELIRQKTSHVRVRGVIYKVTVEPVARTEEQSAKVDAERSAK